MRMLGSRWFASPAHKSNERDLVQRDRQRGRPPASATRGRWCWSWTLKPGDTVRLDAIEAHPLSGTEPYHEAGTDFG